MQDIKDILKNSGNCYIILRLRQIPETALALFSSMQEIKRMKIKLNFRYYEQAYSESLPSFSHEQTDSVLEYILEKIIQDRQQKTNQVKVTVSNVIIIKIDGKVHSFYVDSVGCKYLPDFLDAFS